MMRHAVDSFCSLRARDVVSKLQMVTLMVSISLLLWSAITLTTKSSTSMVVVLSGSMEPGYARGDILFVHNLRQYPAQVGDVVVFMPPGSRIPIIHRVHRLHHRDSDGKRLLLTKGDNNMLADTQLYPYGREWVEEGDVLGKSFFYIPRLGYITLALGEYRWMKVTTITLLFLYSLVSNDMD